MVDSFTQFTQRHQGGQALSQPRAVSRFGPAPELKQSPRRISIFRPTSLEGIRANDIVPRLDLSPRLTASPPPPIRVSTLVAGIIPLPSEPSFRVTNPVPNAVTQPTVESESDALVNRLDTSTPPPNLPTAPATQPRPKEKYPRPVVSEPASPTASVSPPPPLSHSATQIPSASPPAVDAPPLPPVVDEAPTYPPLSPRSAVSPSESPLPAADSQPSDGMAINPVLPRPSDTAMLSASSDHAGELVTHPQPPFRAPRSSAINTEATLRFRSSQPPGAATDPEPTATFVSPAKSRDVSIGSFPPLVQGVDGTVTSSNLGDGRDAVRRAQPSAPATDFSIPTTIPPADQPASNLHASLSTEPPETATGQPANFLQPVVPSAADSKASTASLPPEITLDFPSASSSALPPDVPTVALADIQPSSIPTGSPVASYTPDLSSPPPDIKQPQTQPPAMSQPAENLQPSPFPMASIPTENRSGSTAANPIAATLNAPAIAPLNQAHIRTLLVHDVPVAELAPAVVAETPTKASIGAAERPTVPTSVPAPPPPIEVTIGRIDVRVTPPEPPAKRPRRSAQGPAVSLQDYLNSRNRS